MEQAQQINEIAWEEWCDWRRAEKRKKVTPRAAKMQRKMLSAYSPEVQRAIIEQSIMNDWQGLFPPKGQNVPLGTGTRARTLQDDLTDRSWAQ